MTKPQILLITIIVAITVASCQQTKKNRHTSKFSITKKWESDPALEVPESVCYDSIRNVLYVSNINGKANVKDRDGYISIVSLSGTIIQLDWITNIDAPKGMVILNNHLFVTNIDEIVEISIDSSKIVKRYACKEAKFLNDIALAPDSSLLISGTVNNKIYKLKNGYVTSWATNELIEHPNGLLAEDNRLLIGCNDKILSADYSTGYITEYINTPCSIDGIKNIGKDRYLVSDWKGRIYVVGKSIDPCLILNTTSNNVNAADFELLPDEKTIIVPTFFANSITSYKINVKK